MVLANSSGDRAAPQISLEQWRCLAAVVDEDGYAQAAAALFKSQSAVTYAVQKLESSLDVKVFRIEGRKARLTPIGEMLYQRAKLLLEDAGSLERAARQASSGWEAEISLAVEVLFPTWLLLKCLDAFGKEAPHTTIELQETVIGGAPEALLERHVQLAISPNVPAGFNGETLMSVRAIPVAHPNHPLHRLGRELTLKDLRKHRHLVVRDSGSRRDKRIQSIAAEQRWAVTNMPTSIGAACRGYGFAWLPEDKIRTELDDGVLAPLPLKGGRERFAPLYLIFADADSAGPGVRRLAEIIRTMVHGACLHAS